MRIILTSIAVWLCLSGFCFSQGIPPAKVFKRKVCYQSKDEIFYYKFDTGGFYSVYLNGNLFSTGQYEILPEKTKNGNYTIQTYTTDDDGSMNIDIQIVLQADGKKIAFFLKKAMTIVNCFIIPCR